MGTICRVYGQIEVQDFNCCVGDDFYAPLEFIDSVTGQYEDVTHWQFFSAIYQSYAAKLAAQPALITSMGGTGFTITNGPSGQIGWSIPAMITKDIPVFASAIYGQDVPANNCVYDLVALDENGLQKTQKRGTFAFQLRLSVTS